MLIPILKTWLCGLILSTGISSAMACSVPVFRYALERWPADPFEAVVFYKSELSEAELETVDLLKSSHANLLIREVDLAAEQNPETLETWEYLETDTLPWLYVTYPPSHPVGLELASGPLERTFVTEVIDSPVRQEIANRIVDGETTVWVMIESGDATADALAWGRLNEELPRLESELKLPIIEQEDIDAGLTSVTEEDLRIDFSTIRLSRDDKQEEIFLRMLLDTELDLLQRNEPVVFPIFGRGRVLHAMVGKGIQSTTLEAAAAYLVGACSCQVKADNPGVDLLMSKDWDNSIQSAIPSRPVPELVGLGMEEPVEAALEPTHQPAEELAQLKETAPAKSDRGLILLITLPALGFIAVVVGFGSMLIFRKHA